MASDRPIGIKVEDHSARKTWRDSHRARCHADFALHGQPVTFTHIARWPVILRILIVAPLIMTVVKKTQKPFWNTLQLGNGQPFVYKANAGPGLPGTIVSGHDRGAEMAVMMEGFSRGLFAAGGVKQGETRELDIASTEAFGTKGYKARGITPNSSLFIRVKVVKIEQAKDEI